jgi:hypothetical protein
LTKTITEVACVKNWKKKTKERKNGLISEEVMRDGDDDERQSVRDEIFFYL